MAKVIVELDVWFDGTEGEPTAEEVKEFTKCVIEYGEESCGSCKVDILSMVVKSDQE